MSLEVHIFERKGDYQRFIAEYGLYESEWEIIRGINKTEGHVRTYFETQYRTARKVVEDLLIEEIIEKSFRNNYSGHDENDKLANTLLNIKDKLIELSKKKDEIHNFDRQIGMIDGFIERVSSMKQMYSGMEDTFEEIRRIYRTIAEASENYEKSHEDKVQELNLVLEQKKSFDQKLDTARILVEQDELKKIETDLLFIQEEVEKAEKSVAELEDSLNMMEAANNYFDYTEAKHEYEKLVVVMDNLLKDNTEITDRLKEAVALKKIWDFEQTNRTRRELLKESEKGEQENSAIESLEKEIRSLEKHTAILEYEIAEQTGQLEELDQEMNSLKNETELLLPAQAEEAALRQGTILREITSELAQAKQELSEVREEQFRTKLDYDRSQDSLEEIRSRQEEIQEQSDKIQGITDKIDKLKEVYQENDLKTLEKKIELSYKNAVIRREHDRSLLEDKREQLRKLSEHISVKESEDVESALDYIRRYHTASAVSGAQYLAKLPEEERMNLLRRNPLLVSAVLVSEKAEQILLDYEIPVKQMVPIMEISEIEDLNTTMCYIGNPDKFKDEDMQKQYEALKNQIENEEYLLQRKIENETVIGEDLVFVKMIAAGVLTNYDAHSDRQIEEFSNQMENAEEQVHELRTKLQKLDTKEEVLEQQITTRQKEQLQKEEEIKILSQMVEDLQLYRKTEKKRAEHNSSLLEYRRKYSDAVKRLEAMEQMHTNRQKKMDALQTIVKQAESEWNEKYAKYFDASVYDRINTENKGKTALEIKLELFGEDEIDTVLDGLLSALVSENSSVSDKEQLLNHYQISMQRSLVRLDYLGISQELLDEKYRAKELFRYTQAEMQEEKKKRDEADKLRRQLRRSLDSKRTQRDKLEGKIAHLIGAVEKNYGVFEPAILENHEIYSYITENEAILGSIENKIAACQNGLKEMDEKNVITEMLLKNCDRLMKKSGITPNSDSVKYTELSAEEIENKYNDASEKLDKFIKDRYKRGEDFERELQMLCDILRKAGATELADELRVNVRMPDSMEEVMQLIQSLRETNEMIALEKERVEKGLLDIKVIKENFENQCLQTCINIRTELERLGRLSRITIDERHISMIQLAIPYVNEELYKDRMSSYIDAIVNDADGYEDQEQRLKFIRNHLSWKKMFSVIVTDMNAIRLNLYKRERIASQSRYLPYEEAVGSTGQSQGIYIQFLISIINYISSINSKNADATGLRKVIFIDNPFGAAKDSYIWEPIFKLLKTNNVQLVVPARGATPAITGKFDVNYILGQKMVSGKQQTVVINYYSNVKTDELDYSTLSFEQTSLF